MVASSTLAANQPQVVVLTEAGQLSVSRESVVPMRPVMASWMQVSQRAGIDWAK
ncbi:hypothetical protein D3C72_1485540 [compost metagenome]